MNFAFKLGQRVTVPYSPGVQGVITTAFCSIGTENQYSVRALTSQGRDGTVIHGEGELLEANPTPHFAAKAGKAGKAKR